MPSGRKAGVDYRKRADGMYALRHLYASVLLSQGVSIKELAAYLGHNDPGFTRRTYTHLVPSSFESARTAVDAVFSPTGPTTDGPPTAYRRPDHGSDGGRLDGMNPPHLT